MYLAHMLNYHSNILNFIQQGLPTSKFWQLWIPGSHSGAAIMFSIIWMCHTANFLLTCIPQPQIHSLLRSLKNGLLVGTKEIWPLPLWWEPNNFWQRGTYRKSRVSVLSLWEGRMGALTRERGTQVKCV